MQGQHAGIASRVLNHGTIHYHKSSAENQNCDKNEANFYFTKIKCALAAATCPSAELSMSKMTCIFLYSLM